MKATPFATASGGTAGTALTISFSVIKPKPNIAFSALESSSLSVRPVSGRLQVYPNPIDAGRFRISLPSEASGEVNYTLIELTGRHLVRGKINLVQPSSDLAFDFSDKMLAPGIYYLQLEGKNLKEVVALIKN